MEDSFAVFFDKRILVVLTGFDLNPSPDRDQVLDWYGKNFAFDRSRLSGCYVHTFGITESDQKEMWKEPGMLALCKAAEVKDACD